LDLLTDEKDVAPYHFLMAEALFDAGELIKAIEAFDFIAYQYKSFEKREQAGYNILVAYQKLIEQTDKNKQEQINKYHEQFINYSLLFAEFFPSSTRAPELLLRSAEQLIEFKRIPEAVQTAEKLLALPAAKTKPQTDRAKVIIANGYFDLNQYPKAEMAIAQVLNEVDLSPAERKTFKERRSQAIYKQAEALKLAGELEKAIAEYQRMIATEPSSSVRPNAEIDAAVLLMKLEKWSDAQVALEGFRSRYANHPLAEGLDERLALVYEKQEQWASAAEAYKRIAAKTKDPEKARDIQWYIAELYLKANSPRAAIEAFKTYVWSYTEPFLQAVEAQAKLVELYEQVGDSEKRDFWRNKIIASYRAGGNKNNDRTRYLAAKSAFELAEPLFDEFQKVRLTLPLAKSLKKKRAIMDQALAAYGSVAKYKVAEFTTASTHRVGQLYLILARDIMKSERPKGMSDDEIEEYNYLIEDQAFPIEEKAIEIFSSNTGRVLQNLYDDWIKQSFAELAKLQPARYDKQEVIESWFGGESK
jgi:outer membrane protein assembly factor BamD (BamD/ComL family)